MIELNDLQKDIAIILILRINKDDYTITYDEIKNIIKEISNNEISDRELWDSLGEISTLCCEIGLPPISAICIRKDYGIPGDGFFKNLVRIGSYNTFDESYMDYNTIKLKAKNCNDWHQLVDYLHIDIKFD